MPGAIFPVSDEEYASLKKDVLALHIEGVTAPIPLGLDEAVDVVGNLVEDRDTVHQRG